MNYNLSKSTKYSWSY